MAFAVGVPIGFPWEITWEIPWGFPWEFPWDFPWEIPWGFPMGILMNSNGNSHRKSHGNSHVSSKSDQIDPVQSSEVQLRGEGHLNITFPKTNSNRLGRRSALVHLSGSHAIDEEGRE
jgi:hypothetical protein